MKISHFTNRKVSGISEAKQTLHELHGLLEQSHLERLQNFNKAYWVITKNVLERRKRKHFEDPSFLEKFDGCFAEYYLDALRRYSKNERTPPAWRLAFESCKNTDISPVKNMCLGINAHINNDIAQALADCNADSRHYQDYLYVNEVILDSIYEVIDELHDDSAILNPKRAVIKPVYKAAMNRLARQWRSQAWEHYCQLRGGKMDIPTLEQYAYNMGIRVKRIPI
jgi:hypothetical protein